MTRRTWFSLWTVRRNDAGATVVLRSRANATSTFFIIPLVSCSHLIWESWCSHPWTGPAILHRRRCRRERASGGKGESQNHRSLRAKTAPHQAPPPEWSELLAPTWVRSSLPTRSPALGGKTRAARGANVL